MLAGQKLGIKEVDDGIWLASFIHYDLGYFDLEQKTLQPLGNPFGKVRCIQPPCHLSRRQKRCGLPPPREKYRKRCRNLHCTTLSREGGGHALLCFTAKLGPSPILFGDPKPFGIQSEQIVAGITPSVLGE